jgi:uncharacterized membrane protein
VTAATLLPTQLSSALAQNAGEVLLLLFVALHATVSNGWRGAAAYIAIGLAAGFGLEICNQISGFPYGGVTHNAPGLKLYGVPPGVGAFFMIAGWPAWVMARLIVRRRPDQVSGLALVAMPIAFIPWSLLAPAGSVSNGGRTFVVADIYEAGLIAAILTMLPPALIAIFRLYEPPSISE